MIMGRSPLDCGGRVSKRGFLLVDLLLTICIGSVLAVLVAQGTYLFVGSYKKVQAEAELQNAVTYVINYLDKNISQDAVEVAIQRDSHGADMLACHTYLSSKDVRIISENDVLYLETTTLKGVGKNPIFPIGFKVKQWRVRLVDEKNIFISFTLEKNSQSRGFTQLLTVINGSAHDER